jgi:hypothetical protein
MRSRACRRRFKPWTAFLDIHGYSRILGLVAKTKREKHAQNIYLEPEKAELLDELAEVTRIAKAVLLREAVDDLLVKHRKQLKASKSKP